MVEAAIWLMVQGDRAGAEDLLVQALRLDPTHERARQAMKSVGAITRPGEQSPRDPALDRPITQPVLAADPGRTPAEAQPGVSRGPVPMGGAPPRGTLPHGAMAVDAWGERPGDTTLPGGGGPPFSSSPSGERRDDRTDRHVMGRLGEGSSTQPRLELGKSWSLEVLNGPHVGVNLPVARRPMMVGRGLGVLDVESDVFMSSAHATFFQRAGELWISDGGSASGTWLSVDGPTRLNPGDSFSIGLQRLRYLGPLETPPAQTPWQYGAPRPASTWRLEHVLLGDRPARTWLLRGVVTLGRDGATVKFPEDESLMPVHAELRPAGAAIELIDRAARATTYAMVPTGAERRLLEGTRVRLGSTIFRVISS